MEKVKYVTYKVLIAKERATSVFYDMITIPENKPYSEIPAFISAYVRTRLENIMLTEEERAEICNDKKTYEQGLADAWEAARKVAAAPINGGFSIAEVGEIFDSGNIDRILNVYKPAEAIAKIKAYEEEQQKIEQEIKVGDEVCRKDRKDCKFVVTAMTKDKICFDCISQQGVFYQFCDPNLIEKTGRHFSQVEELLKAMKEE